MGSLASGVGIAEAKQKHLITNADIETMTRLPGGLEMERWQEARLAGRKTSWSQLDFDEICDRIAGGMKIKEALSSVRGTEAAGDFYRLVNRDPDMKAQFLEAQAAGMIALGESVLDIADDTTNDTLVGPKGGEIPNMAAVSRSKLQVESRFKRMGHYHTKLFGEKKDSVQVNVQINHAETLEAARDRAKLRDKRVTPKQMTAAIDAAFSEKTETPAETWVDEPMDTVWREET